MVSLLEPLIHLQKDTATTKRCSGVSVHSCCLCSVSHLFVFKKKSCGSFLCQTIYLSYLRNQKQHAPVFLMMSSLLPSEGARLLYEDLGDATPSIHEEFRPVMHRACCPPPTAVSSRTTRYSVQIPGDTGMHTLTVLPPPPPHSSSVPTQILPITLLRHLEDGNDRHRNAYARIPGNKVIQLNHHDPNWGILYFAVVYPLVQVVEPPPPPPSSSQQQQDSPPTSHHWTFQVPREDTAQYVAVKQLSRRAVDRYLRKGGQENPYKEILRMQELGDNQHVLTCVDALMDDDYLYIVTPKGCAEGTLKDVIPWFDTANALPMSQVKMIFTQLCEILLYLERHGICHRDLSPDNFLFLTPTNLVAFDLALSLKVPNDPVTGHRTKLAPEGNFGTYPYMAPEVYANFEYDSLTTDLWSVMVILYNLLTCQVLYELPHPVDLSFRFFLLARGLSSTPHNERTAEILMDSFRPQGHNNNVQEQQRQFRLTSNLMERALAHLALGEEAMELLEYAFQLNPADRLTLAQIIESDFMADLEEDDEEMSY